MKVAFFHIDNTAINVKLAQMSMTRKELCKKACIDPGNFSRMTERGTVKPKTAGRIAAALGVDVSQIIKLPEE